MNGRDIFLALDFIGEDLVEQAEFDAFPAPRRRMRPLLAAALIAVLLLAGCAVAYTQGWFADFFQASTQEPLTQGQMGYLQEHEQIIAQAQTHDGWTIELRSALNDGTTAYIILGVTAPEDVSLEPRMDGDERLDLFLPGNESFDSLITCTRGVTWDSIHLDWAEDGDGLANTKNCIIQINPDRERSLMDPFGSRAVYHITIENITRQFEDKVYLQHLLDTKYKDHENGYMLDSEDAQRVWQTEVLAEGIWEFDLTLDGNSPQLELLTAPITTQALAYQVDKGGIYEPEDVTLTSVILHPLSVTLYFEPSANYPLFATGDNQVFAVRKDGSRIQLLPSSTQGLTFADLQAETPLVFDELDHILLADGTVIPVP